MDQVAELLDDPRILYLSEMMDYPGVLTEDEQVMAKIRAARERGKPVDGHAPGLRGDKARRYFAAGISSDHECCCRPEALEKLACGAKILIREGSAARNFDALNTLIDEYPDQCMFCSDDKHPDELLAGHINELVKRAVACGRDRMNTLRVACVTPVLHYGLDVGLLRPGDDADFIEVENLESWRQLKTYVRGQLVSDRGRRLIKRVPVQPVNRFHRQRRSVEEFACPVPPGAKFVNVIEALDGQLVTRQRQVKPLVVHGAAVSDANRDVLKLTVVNRFGTAPPAIGFVTNFGLQCGAIASSVAHDSHNVIAVGVTDEDLCAAVNLVIETGGGLSVATQGLRDVLPLPVAGLMSTEGCNSTGSTYAALDQLAKHLGSRLCAPFMTLSFMALLVIPEIKLSDRGLFDGNRFEFLPLFVDS